MHKIKSTTTDKQAHLSYLDRSYKTRESLIPKEDELNMMKKIRIRKTEDLDKLPDDEVVEVAEWDLDVGIVEEKEVKLLIKKDEVQLPVDRETYDKIRNKKISLVLQSEV